MAGENDLIKLYSGRILALAADIPNSVRLEAPAVTVKKRSPLCGSTVTVDVEFEGQTVSAFGQDVKACALGQAAASVIGGAIVGASLDQVKQAQGALQTLLTEGGPPPQAPFEGLEVLRPARQRELVAVLKRERRLASRERNVLRLVQAGLPPPELRDVGFYAAA